MKGDTLVVDTADEAVLLVAAGTDYQGFAVDIEWQDGKLKQARIHNVSADTGRCVVRYAGRTKTVKIARGGSAELGAEAFEAQ